MLDNLQEQLDGLKNRMDNKLIKLGRVSPDLTIHDNACAKAYWGWRDQNPVGLLEEEVEKWRERLNLSLLVTVSMDKYHHEAIILCPLRWARKLSEFSTLHHTLTQLERNRLWEELMTWGKRLKYLPFCRLHTTVHHRFGSLRYWPKHRSIDTRALVLPHEAPHHTVPDDYGWHSIEWRPMVSYSEHHWRGLLKLLSRWCVFTVEKFTLGFAVSNPRHVSRHLTDFNRSIKPNEYIITEQYDVKEFFPSVPRDLFEAVVHFYILAHLHSSPLDVYF